MYPRDIIVIEGREAKPPRYYDRFMDRKDEHGGTMERRAIMDGVRDTRYADAVELSRYTLDAGEKIAQSRINLFQGRHRI